MANKIFNDLANFLTNMVARGATDDELERGIRFSADVIQSYNYNDMGEILNKYMDTVKTPDEIYEQMKVNPSVSPEDEFYRQTDKALTALGTYKDPNLTWTAEELGIKR